MPRTKYLVIKNSTVNADSLGNFYPDVLTFPVSKFIYNDVPAQVTLTQGDIARFDIFIYTYYGISDYQDLILSLNGIPSVHELYVGQILKLPSTNDINIFYNQYMV
jgi:hypothetical protein